ncbi:post-GPI attachment to proteins factor 4-like [Mercenaria mercenaria]|uniref:post-GPI attachment to proteins factor 4-like n=1 Tax=Mercenaria mercenaria TaxID=6596 RepID=UPI00234E537A|nr:post-GPI attachment to proteins factor 4-like [Mercenaria mercenaria]
MHVYVCFGSVAAISVIYISAMLAADIPFSTMFKYFHSYSENLEKAKSKNRGRTTKALDYIYTHDKPFQEMPSSPERYDLDLLVVVVTISREKAPRSQKTGYLLQTATAVDKLMNRDKYFTNKIMLICNVDKNPKAHEDAVELQSYLPFINKDGGNNLGFNVTGVPELKDSGLRDEARRQEIVDYAFCLNVSLSMKHRYALILEDDVIPYKNLFEVLHHTLKYRLPEHKRFSFLKLYFPTRWQGYAFETDRILELISIGTIGGALFSVIASCFDFELSRGRKGSSSIGFFICGFLCFLAVAKILGRVQVLELRRLTPFLYKFGPSSACCTQAMLYKRETLPHLIQHLLINNSLNKDLAIYDFSEKYGVQGYQLEPNLFLHTGMRTSLSSNVKNPEEFLFDLPFLE